MKNFISILLVLTLAVSLAACGKKSTADDPDADMPVANVQNPLHEGTAEDVAAATGFLLTAPEGAEGVRFASIDGDPKMAQMAYVQDGITYTYRLLPSEEPKDISGLYYTWTSTEQTEIGGLSAELNWIEGADGHITWFDEFSGVVYDLSMDGEASALALISTASRLFCGPEGNADGDNGTFAMEFSALLSDFSESCQPGTAGVSLRYAAFASELADLFTECQPTQDTVGGAVEGFIEALDEEQMAQFPALLNNTLTIFLELGSDHGEELQSACGYAPKHEWDAAALEPLFRAMCMSAPWDAAYASIIDKYVTAVQNGDDRQTMRDKDMNDLAADVGDAPMDALGYLIDDLDGNGIRELVIGTISDDDFRGKLILDLYTLDESGVPTLLFRSRERDRLYSAGSNVFANVGSSGASDSVFTTLELKNGELIDLKKEMPTEYYSQLDLTPLSEW